MAAAAAVAALVALSAWARWRALASSPYPVGVDGYYYAVQLRGLLESGQLAYPASPLGFWLMAPLAAATDPITGAKLGAALGGALVAVPAFGLGRRLGGGASAGVAAAAVAATSAGSVYLSLEFVKQGLGVSVGLAALWAIARALERPSAGRIAAAGAGVLAAALTHKTAAVLVALAAAPALLVELRARRRLGARAAIAAAVVIGLAAVAGVLAPARFVGARDLALVAGLVGEARWVGVEALLAGAIGAAVLVLLATGRRDASSRPADRALAAALAALGVAIALPWLDVADPDGLGYRLRALAFVPLALGIATAGGAAIRRPRFRAAALLAVAAAWTATHLRPLPAGVVRAHPAMVAAVQALRGVVPAGDVVITRDRQVAFQVAWYVRVPVRSGPEPVPPARRWWLLTLAAIGDGSRLDRALTRARAESALAPPRGLHPRDPNGLVVMPDATWAWVQRQVP